MHRAKLYTDIREIAQKHEKFHSLIGNLDESYGLLDFIASTSRSLGVKYEALLDKSYADIEAILNGNTANSTTL